MRIPLMPQRPQAVIFDLDGTLIDTANDFIHVVQRMRSQHGLPPLPAAAIRRRVSDGASALVTLALGSEPEHPDHESLRLEFLDHYAELLGQHAQPYPGMHALIKHLGSQSIPWGVATNKARRFAEPLMAKMKFLPAPGSLVTPCDVTQPKPHPESIILACQQLKADPAKSIYVGDHLRDIDAGRAAGCFTIAAAYGYIDAGDRPGTWGADAMASTALDLTTMIMRMTP